MKANENLSNIEKRISTSLKPVIPRSAFVNELRSRLLNQIAGIPIQQKPKADVLVLAIIAGFFSSVMILVIGIRSLVMLLSAIGLLSHYKKVLDEKQTSKVEPSM